eukprot:m.40056 g.40056  ORF g.40056 m.40056 type:complete len:307 (-) comp10392_c0_seq1:3532-4452(-)
MAALQGAQGEKPGPNGQSGIQMHKCRYCSAMFRWPSSLSRHERTHTGEKPHVCPECNKGFSQKAHLKAHMLRHKEAVEGGDATQGSARRGMEKRSAEHVCPHCSRVFTRKHNLTEHVRTHTKVAPYACTVCKATFKKSGDLQRHKRIHTGERPYACPLCLKAFRQRTHLTTHMQTHREQTMHTNPSILAPTALVCQRPTHDQDFQHQLSSVKDAAQSEHDDRLPLPNLDQQHQPQTNDSMLTTNTVVTPATCVPAHVVHLKLPPPESQLLQQEEAHCVLPSQRQPELSLSCEGEVDQATLILPPQK